MIVWRSVSSEEEALAVTKKASSTASLGLRFPQSVVFTFEGLEELGECLEKSHVSGLRFDHLGARAAGLPGFLVDQVVRCLRSSSSLECLWFGGGIDEDDVIKLGQGLTRNSSLRELQIESTKVGIEGPKALAMYLAISESIEELTLIHLGLQPLALKAFAVSLKVNRSLLVLDLSFNQIGEEGAMYLGSGLFENSTLVTLSLAFNALGQSGAALLAEGLGEESSLTHLNVNSNGIRDRGAVALAAGLRRLKGLRHLHLSYNELSDVSAKAVLELLDDGCLETLDLSGNQITNALMQFVGECVFDNYTLRELDLSENRFTDIEDIAWSIKYNHTLTRLSLFGYKFRKDHLEQINAKTAQNAEKVAYEEATEALRAAIKYGSSGPWMRCKLMVIGQGGAGKTATVRSLLFQDFVAEHISTVGVDLAQSQVSTGAGGSKWREVDTNNIKYTAEFAAKRGTEEAARLRNRSDRQLRAKQRESTVPGLGKGMKKPEAKTEPQSGLMSEEVLHGYLGTDKLVTDEQRSLELGKLVRKAREDKDSLVLTMWDYGGQSVFYTLHHVFLTRYGIYLLVFNMRAFVRNRAESTEYLSFWLNSVGLHAPEAPLFLVGTRADNLSSEQKLEVTSQVLSIHEASFKQLRSTGKRQIFAIDNRTGTGVDYLRGAIEATARGLDFVNAPVSIRWMQCLDKTVERASELNLCWLKIQEVKSIAETVGVRIGEELDDMLRLFHELGVVLYFTATQNLRQLVITDPQWLIDGITQVIRDDKLHKRDETSLEQGGLSEDARLLESSAIATRDLLNHLWGSQHADFMLDLMLRMLLLSRWTYDAGSDKREMYLVPSLFQDKAGESLQGVACRFTFNCLPLGIFQRLICVCLAVLDAAYSQQLHSTGRANDIQAPELYMHWAKLFFNGDAIELQESRKKKRITVTFGSITAAPRLLSMIVSMLVKIREDVMGKGLKWITEVPVDTTNSSYVNLKDAIKNKLDPWYRQPAKSTMSRKSLEEFASNLL